MTKPITGIAAGVPYLALPPKGAGAAPLVVAWHMMDPPASETDLAAALPMNDLPAWRVYCGLPRHGSRAPCGPQEMFRLAAEDAVLNIYAPVFEQGAEEFPSAVAALRAQLPIADGPIGLVGGSAGGAVALGALVRGEVPVAAAALVNPISRLADLIAANEDRFGVTYTWTRESAAAATRLDFTVRTSEIAAHLPQPAILLIEGADDHAAVRVPLAELFSQLNEQYSAPERLAMITVPGMGHAFSAPAPRLDAAITDWLARHLVAGAQRGG